MARYIDADKVLDDMLCEMAGTGYQAMAMNVIKYAETADVVPKSEVDRLTVELEAMRTSANSYKMHYENAKKEVAREIFEELYKSVASKVPMKIRPIFKDLDFEDGYTQGKCEALIEVFADIAELKKKYTESEGKV